jgi:hypothetical protein
MNNNQILQTMQNIGEYFGWRVNKSFFHTGWTQKCPECLKRMMCNGCPFDERYGHELILFAAYAKAEMLKNGWIWLDNNSRQENGCFYSKTTHEYTKQIIFDILNPIDVALAIITGVELAINIDKES